MSISWKAVDSDRLPELGERVLVRSRTDVWTTKWNPVLADKQLPAPITHFAPLEELGFELQASRANLEQARVTSAERHLMHYYAGRSPKRGQGKLNDK